MPVSFTFCNQKGGVGKTTLSFHLAHFLNQLGKKVLVVDLDGQGNISSRLAENLTPGCYRTRHLFEQKLKPATILNTESGIDLIYANDGDEELHAVERMDLKVIGDFSNNLSTLAADYDFVIIDTPPAPGVKLYAGVCVAEHIYVPVELSAFAVSGVSQIIRSFGVLSRSLDTEIRCAGIIINKFNNRVDSHHQAMEEIRANIGNLIMRCQLVNRGTLDNALTHGKPVWDLRSTGAQRETGYEMVDLMEEICLKAGIDTKSHPTKLHPRPQLKIKPKSPAPSAKADLKIKAVAKPSAKSAAKSVAKPAPKAVKVARQQSATAKPVKVKRS